MKDFKVNIETLTAPITRQEFGRILIVGDSADKDYMEFSTLADLELEYADTTDEYAIATVLFNQRPKPTKVAVVAKNTLVHGDINDLLTPIKNEGWFGVVCTINNADMIAALTTFAENNDKMYAVTTENLASVDTQNSDNAIIGYHNDIACENFVVEALLQHLLVREVGGTTGKARRLEGIEPAEITSGDLETLTNNNGFTYIVKTGIAQTTEGTTSSGEYIDVVLGRYFIEFRIEEGLARLLVNTPKIPYSNEGISQMVSVVRNVLNQSTEQGIILVDDDGNGVFEITFVPREKTDTNDIANRVYNGISFTATLAGGIHSGTISGELIL